MRKNCIKNEEHCVKNDEFCRRKGAGVMNAATMTAKQTRLAKANVSDPATLS